MQSENPKVEAFTEYLIGIGMADRTITNYTMRLKQVIRWVGENGADPSLEELTPSQIRELAAAIPRSNTAQRQLRTTMKHYWMMRGVVGPVGAFRVPPRPKPRWRGIEDDQVDRLLDVALGDWPRGGAVLMGLYLGARRAEIAGLRWADFEDDLSWVRILGKGERVRHLPVHRNLQGMLRAVRWPIEYVFPGRMGGHVNLYTINIWIAEMGEAAGVEGLTPHRLRHTAIGKIADASGNIYMAQGFAGHAQVETTQVYTRLGRDRLVEAMGTFDGWGTDPDPEPSADAEVITFRPAGTRR